MCKLASLASFLLTSFYYYYFFLPYLLIKSPSRRLPHLGDSLYSAASLTTKGGDIPFPSYFPKHATSRDYKLTGLAVDSLTIPSAAGPPFYE